MKQMSFSQEGFLCKVAYDWRGETPPEKTNFCKFSGKVTSSLFIACFMVITRVFGWPVRVIGAIPMLLLCGYRPAGPDWRFLEADDGPEALMPFEPIKRWAKSGKEHFEFVQNTAGVAAGLFWLSAVIFVVYLAIKWVAMKTTWFFSSWVFGTTIGTTAFWLVFLVVALKILHSIFSKAEWWKMLTGYIEVARKGLCPEVVFK